MDCVFEKMTMEHALDVMEIYNWYIANSFSAYPEKPLPENFFMNFLEIGKKFPCFVVKPEGGAVAGFCLLRPYNPFPVFRNTAEVSYFFHRDYTGKGLGRIALERLESEARAMGVKTLLADISTENQGSMGFHAKHGFTECGRFENVGEKFGRPFGVVWMRKDL
jgi:phosphinothricin acetyltransferase